ncbi:osmoprotectant transport system substrate-binding protein [Herbihabitans rhizosphaerae]|uniref:Osmoprotectant transport system substrate-binding protein n=1 Tax=Herbihabitans rhizosphaerae TaxID=1872711 RepID=A0A4Q7KCJ6_9PSEU|nr:glycine betaine ABC transporter substrate-binding protein [Herbihabitans rhizosphaerae]RZS30355.1 osmoprotectant transport system substrate-binding protein [Herbihabitans rhizosphaerae]
MRKHRMFTAVLGLAMAAGMLAGCTIEEDKGSTDTKPGSGSIKEISSLRGVKLNVSSKEFDEQLLLGQIAIVALRAAGADPVDKTNITGSDNVRKALVTSEIDLYWEYTGTAWVSFLRKTEKFAEPQQMFDAVKAADAANGVTWFPAAPANNTYAIAVSSGTKAKHNITTLSDYAALAKRDPAAASTCMGPEFTGREDGFAGLQKAYGFALPGTSIHELNDAVVYPTAGKGDTCAFGSVAATDGRIPAQKLTPLVDDKKFFPIYNPAITIRAPIAGQHPGLEQIFGEIAKKLTTDQLTELNKKVSVDGQKPITVATEWMKSAGFIG